MGEKNTPLMTKPSTPINSKVAIVAEVVALSVTTIVLLATFVINGLAGSADYAKFGFKNQTGDVSDQFYLQITPAGWAFSIWGIIYTAQALWVLYGWTFVFRPSFKKTINPLVYVFYTLANVGNIIWIYLWGNEYVQAAFPFIFSIAFFLWCAIGVEVVYLHYIKPPSDDSKRSKIDYYLSQIVVVNGLAIYATWVSIATLLNFTMVLHYYGDYNAANSATLALSILSLELIVYFVLENTILDRFLRFVFMVYPVVIWALSAVISAHIGDADTKRNNIFTIVLLVIAIILFIVRAILWIVFAFVRPLPKKAATAV